MLGKSGGMALLLVATFAAACAHNVPQDAATGPDGKPKGAKTLTFENNEAKAKGIVTYPGGDRVDWRLIEIPDKQRGNLDIKLTWVPPRPGLQLAFDVFDEWNTPVIASKKSSKKSAGRSRSVSLAGAHGKYYLRIFAVGRGDAGTYKLTVDFAPQIAGPAFDPLKLEIAEPPRLAAVPEAEIACDEFAFDQKNPACKSVCPQTGAPPGWPACAGKCPTPPDINIPACLATMPCPTPPDRRVKACPASKWPKCDLKAPDANNPNCDNATADPVKGRVLKADVQGSDVIITIGVGTDQGVGKSGWSGKVLRGDSDVALSGGDVTIIKIDKRQTIGKVHLTTDQVNENPWVKLSPPPK
jgi:hypothetical protein